MLTSSYNYFYGAHAVQLLVTSTANITDVKHY